MIRLLAAELLKLRTTLGVWGFLLAVVGLVALAVVGQLASRDDVFDARAGQEELLDALEGAGAIVPVFALLLGILAFTAEFRHGTITQTFLVSPVRERVLTAKALAFGLVGALFAAVAAALIIAIAVPWLSGEGVSATDTDALTTIGAVLAASALWGVLGVGVGALVRSQVLAIVGALVWLLVLENVLGAFAGDIVDYLPGFASRAMTTRDRADEFAVGLSPGVATIVTASYSAAFAILGGIALSRRDA